MGFRMLRIGGRYLIVLTMILAVAGMDRVGEAVRSRLVCTATAQAATLGGCWPLGGLVMGRDGALYGTSWAGGDTIRGGTVQAGTGRVFQLTPPARGNGIWTETVLHSFGDSGGAHPAAGLAMAADGALYGTTYASRDGEGSVFALSPRDGVWRAAQLYEFPSLPKNVPPKGLVADGAKPTAALTIGADGALYGTTSAGGFLYPGRNGAGTAFTLTPGPSGWSETVIYRFKPRDASGRPTGDGGMPLAGLVADASGALYGTTAAGGGDCDCGIVFALVPGNSGWTERILHVFRGGNDGARPMSSLVMDARGALYGTTRFGGAANNGTVFALTPTADGSYREKILTSFAGDGDGDEPVGALLLDGSGALYGTTMKGGGSANCADGCGTVFKLANLGGVWTRTTLHSFRGIGASPRSNDGAYPVGGLVADEAGMLYGVTANGGEGSAFITPDLAINCDSGEPGVPRGCGTVFSIDP